MECWIAGFELSVLVEQASYCLLAESHLRLVNLCAANLLKKNVTD